LVTVAPLFVVIVVSDVRTLKRSKEGLLVGVGTAVMKDGGAGGVVVCRAFVTASLSW